MKINTRFLKSHPLLAMLPLFSLRRLIKQAALDEYPKGTQIFQQGEACDAIFLVISGRCESRLQTRLAGSGVEAVYGPGDSLGAREFLSHEPYRSTVTVLTHSILMRIPAVDLERLFLKKPSVAGRFAQVIFQTGSPRRDGALSSSAARFTKGAEECAGKVAEVIPPAARRSLGGHSRRPPQLARRVVSLVSLTGGAATRRSSTSLELAGAVRRVTGRSTLLVQVGTHEGGVILSHWPEIAARCNAFGGEFCLRSFVKATPSGAEEIAVSVGKEPHEREFVPVLLSHLGKHYDYVVLSIDCDFSSPVAMEWLVQSDIVYVLLRQRSQETTHFERLMADLEKEGCSAVRPILFGGDSAPDDVFENDLLKMGRPLHAYIRSTPPEGETLSPQVQQQFNRLAREIGQCRVGLALSSGGAKGLAHIGVIQVLEENGIEVDFIAGSSMGAYVGASWAYGHTGQSMERFARELENRWGLLRLMEPVLPPRQGFINSIRACERLQRMIGEADFATLVRPFRVVATRLETMERVIFSSGNVVKAVEASIAIPGICVPVGIDGEFYIDGGIADPLPVDVLVEMGVERIIAVNTIPTPEQLRLCVDREEGLAPQARPGWRRVADFLNRHMNYFAYGNILDTMYRSTHGMQMRVAELACREADVVLWAISSDAAWHDFTHPGKYIALGRRVAEAHLIELKSLIQGGSNEPNPQQKKSVAFAA